MHHGFDILISGRFSSKNPTAFEKHIENHRNTAIATKLHNCVSKYLTPHVLQVLSCEWPKGLDASLCELDHQVIWRQVLHTCHVPFGTVLSGQNEPIVPMNFPPQLVSLMIPNFVV